MQTSKCDPLLGRYMLRVGRARKRGATQEKDAKQHCCFGYHFKMSCNQTPWLLDGLCSLGKGALVQTGYKVEPHLGVRSPQAGERRGLTSPAARSLPLSTGQGYATGRDLEVLASFGRSIHSGSGFCGSCVVRCLG